MRTRLFFSLWISIFFSFHTSATTSNFHIPNPNENMFEEMMMMGCAFEGEYTPVIAPNTFQDAPLFSESNGQIDVEFIQRSIGGTDSYRSILTLDNEGNPTYSNSTNSPVRPQPGEDFGYEVTTSFNNLQVRNRSFPNGNTLWTRTYPVSGQVQFWRPGTATKVGNRIVIEAGFRRDNIDYRIFLITDLNGIVINRSASTTSNLFAFISDVESTPDGGYIMKYLNNDIRTAGLIKINQAAAIVYERGIVGDLVSNREFFAGIASNNSGYYVGMSSVSNNNGSVMKYDLNTGNLIWDNVLRNIIFPNPDPQLTVLRQIIRGTTTTSDGGLVVGYTFEELGSNIAGELWFIKFDTNGNVVWTRQINENIAPQNQTINIEFGTQDGGFLTSDNSGGSGITITKYNADGLRLPECTTGSGCNVNITSSNGGVTITGLTSDANTKLFDSNTQAVWSCNPWQGNVCTGNETVAGLVNGATYFLSVQSAACNEWIPIVIQGGGNNPTCNDGIQNQGEEDVDCGGPCAPCNTGGGCNVAITSSNGGVTITGLTSDANTKLFDPNTQVVFSCNPWQGNVCTGNETVSGLIVGETYFLSVQSSVCNEWIPIVIQGNSGCLDTDNDGVCNEDDCRPTNPALPAMPGSSCNDFNSNTENDIIQPDGCNCEGTPITGLCEASFTQGTSGIFISGLTPDSNVKLFDVNFQEIFACNPWNGNPCATNGQEILGLTPGGSFFLSIQSANCDQFIPITLSGDGGQNLPDLSANNLNIGSGTPGQVIEFTFNLVNQGNMIASGNYAIESFISTDANISSDDVQEGTIITGNTQIGSTQVTGAITVPNLPAGAYFFYLIVDIDGVIVESNNLNNTVFANAPFIIESNNNGCNTINVALGKSASQSSTLNFGGINSGASNAIDGNTNGNYFSGSVAATTDQSQPWWQVDLGGVFDVSSIEVYNRTDGQNRLNDFYILTSNNPYTSGNLGNARNNSTNERLIQGQAGTPTTWNLGDEPMRYIRIQKTGSGFLTLAELVVNGCPSQMIENTHQSLIKLNEVIAPSLAVGDLFPNPTTGEVFSKIESSFDGSLDVRVVNILGQLVDSKIFEVTVGQNYLQLELDQLENGIYNVMIFDGKEWISRQLVITK